MKKMEKGAGCQTLFYPSSLFLVKADFVGVSKSEKNKESKSGLQSARLDSRVGLRGTGFFFFLGEVGP